MPLLQRIGYNIDAEHPGSNRQYAADAQINMRSTATLILDDHKSDWFYSRQIAARSPSTLRICRTFMRKDANGGWDGNLWEAPNDQSPTGFLDAPRYIDFLQGLNAPDGTIHQVLCEPAARGDRARVKVAWLVSVIKEASKRGERLCVDNPQPVVDGYDEDVANGIYDPLWFALAQHPEHIYGIHEYWLGDAWFNTSKAGMLRLTERISISTDFLLLPDDVLKAAYVANPLEAHLGRCEVIAQRCRLIGASIPRMVYTEIGADHVRLGELAAVEAINGSKPLGYPTMRHYWHVRYPQWSPAQTFTEMCEWLNRAMPSYVIGACLFGFDTAFENGTYHLEESGENGLQALLKAYADEVRTGTPQTPNTPPVEPQTPIPQQPPPVLFLATPTLAEPTALNVRVSPSGQIIDSVKPGEPVSVIAPANASALIGVDKQWVQVTTARNVTGWCAAWLLKRLEPPPVVTPQVNTDWRPSIVGVRREIMLQAKEGKLAETQGLIMDLVAIADSYAAEIQRLLGIINGK